MIKCKIRFFELKPEGIVQTRSIKVKLDHLLDADEVARQRMKPDERFHTIEFKK